jgi:hypothetical protein
MDQNADLRNQLAKAEREGHFFFCPTRPLPKINYLYVPVLQVVKLQPDDFYPVQGGKSFGMHAHGYKKLAKAAGIEWVSEYGRSGRMDDRRDPNFCLYCAVAKFLKMDGRFHEEPAYKHIDLNAKRTSAEEKYEKQYDAKTKGGKKVWPPEKEDYVKLYADRDVNQIRDTIDERCESGAKARAVRSVLDLPVSFKSYNGTHDGIAKRFYLVRITPDPASEQIQRMQYAALTQSFLGIYGVAPPQQMPAMITSTRDAAEDEQEPEETPDDEAIDPSVTDFENSSPEEQEQIIMQMVTEDGYKHFDRDMQGQPPLEQWSQENRSDYFKHLLSRRPQ